MSEYTIKDNLGREYLVEVEKIPEGDLDAQVILHKIKSPDDKCFTIEYQLSRRLLSTDQAPKSIDDYLRRKTKGIIVEGEITEDYIIEIKTVPEKRYPSKVKLKQHSAC